MPTVMTPPPLSIYQNSAWQQGLEDTSKELNEHDYSFLLFVSSKPHYQAEFLLSSVRVCSTRLYCQRIERCKTSTSCKREQDRKGTKDVFVKVRNIINTVFCVARLALRLPKMPYDRVDAV